jgi:hypothetical protein
LSHAAGFFRGQRSWSPERRFAVVERAGAEFLPEDVIRDVHDDLGAVAAVQG